MRHISWFLILTIVLVGSLGAQEFSQRQDIAIFSLNYFGAPVTNQNPNALELSANFRTGNVSLIIRGAEDPEVDRRFQQALGTIDSDIRRVFVNLGRFNVIGLPQRLSDNDVAAFIDSIRRVNEENIQIPEGVRLGQVAFTQADFNRLVGAFYVVIPSVTQYSQERNDAGNWVTRITTNFTIIDVENYRTLAAFAIETSGTNQNPNDSMRSAVGSIPGQLDFQIRSIRAFQIRTGIIEILGPDIYLEFGRNMGIRLGEEFRIYRFTERAGRQTEVPIGLLLVREVAEDYSVAIIRYSQDRLVVGDQVGEIPRAGLVFEPYFKYMFYEFTESGNVPTGMFGVRGTLGRGFFGVRPTFGFNVMFGEEISDISSISTGYFNFYGGAEFNSYLGRLRPNLNVGIGGTFSTQFDEDVDPEVPFFHLHTNGRVGILLSDSVELVLEVGAMLNIAINNTLNTFGGFTGGIGFTFR
jgi:hypothetical protein